MTNTGWRLRGSGKAVKLLQHDAFDALEKEAIEDEAASRSAADAQAVPPDARATFAGLARAQLLQSAAKVVLPATTKKHQRLRDDTKNWYKKNSAWTLQRISQRASTVAPAAGKCRHQLDREQETAHQHDRGQDPADPQAVARGVAANEGAEVLAHGSKRR